MQGFFVTFSAPDGEVWAVPALPNSVTNPPTILDFSPTAEYNIN